MIVGVEIYVRYFCKMILVKKNDNDYLCLWYYKVYKYYMNECDNEGK